MAELRRTFRPEFLNRIDEIVRLPPAGARRARPHRRHAARRGCASCCASASSTSSCRPRRGRSWPTGLRPRLRRPAAQAGASCATCRIRWRERLLERRVRARATPSSSTRRTRAPTARGARHHRASHEAARRRRVMMADTRMKDLYKILGVAEDADDATIKKPTASWPRSSTPTSPARTRRRPSASRRSTRRTACSATRRSAPEYDRLKHAPVAPRRHAGGVRPRRLRQAFGGGGDRGAAFSSAATSTISATSSPACSAAAGGGGPDDPAWGRARAGGRGADMVGQLADQLPRRRRSGRDKQRAHRRRQRRRDRGPAGRRDRRPAACSPARARRRPARAARRATCTRDRGDRPTRTCGATRRRRRARPADQRRARRRWAPRLRSRRWRAGDVSIPPGTSSGAKLRLRGKGIKKPDGTRGDQILPRSRSSSRSSTAPMTRRPASSSRSSPQPHEQGPGA